FETSVWTPILPSLPISQPPSNTEVSWHDQQISGRRASVERLRLLPGGRKTMITLNRGDLEAAIAAAGIPTGHPIEPFLSDPEFETALEDAAYGSEAATSAVRRRAGRRVSAADLAQVKQNAARVGRDGAGLVSFCLAARNAAGELITYGCVI